MRPLTDRFRVCREKLAYLVDSTAAPVAGISIFSTWVAFEVSQYAPQLPAAGMSAEDGYSIFIQTIPYRFYCLFALALCGLVAFTGRDFGPMLAAERGARATGDVVRKDGTPMVSDLVTKMTPAEGVTTRAWRAKTWRCCAPGLRCAPPRCTTNGAACLPGTWRRANRPSSRPARRRKGAARKAAT